MNTGYVYLVTTIHIGNPVFKGGFLITERQRCVGWYSDFHDAWMAVTENMGDIYEMGHYDHCVIEKVDEGIYPVCKESWWFQWRGSIENGQYIAIPKPKGLENIVNFGIG